MSETTSQAAQNARRAVEAEQAVLGALLLSEAAYDAISGLSEADFGREDHRAIFRAATALLDSGKPADVLTVADSLERRGELERCGGRAYLATLATSTPSVAAARHYAEIVRRERLARDLRALAAEIVSGIEAGELPTSVAEQAEQRLYGLHDRRGDTAEAVPFAVTLDETLIGREQREQGLPTGLQAVDALMTGMKSAQLIVVAARPGMGKSALATNIAEHVASLGHGVLLLSLEMSRREIGERILRWHERELGQSEAVARLCGLPLFIETPARLTLAGCRRSIRRLKRRHPVSLVVVDYLQLMQGEGENRTQEIGSISRGLKAIAREFGVPIIALSQLNRAVEQRQDKRPLMSDLRESGDIEADADVVLTIYRDEEYNPTSPAAGTAEVAIRKNRNGPTGMAVLSFDKSRSRFGDYAGPPISTTPARPARKPLAFLDD